MQNELLLSNMQLFHIMHFVDIGCATQTIECPSIYDMIEDGPNKTSHRLFSNSTASQGQDDPEQSV